MGWARAEAPAAQLVTPLELLRVRWVEPAGGARTARVPWNLHPLQGEIEGLNAFREPERTSLLRIPV